MIKLSEHLELSRCSHCSVAMPSLQKISQFETRTHAGKFLRRWRCYICKSCGGVITAWADGYDNEVKKYFPQSTEADEIIPDKPRDLIQQAIDSIHAPAGAVMLAASAVDAMLKILNYKEGNLYNRIEQAAQDHLITNDMAKWAHEVRLDANDQRHADEGASLPEPADAKRCIDFTLALSEFLFVLPSRVTRGIEEANPSEQ